MNKCLLDRRYAIRYVLDISHVKNGDHYSLPPYYSPASFPAPISAHAGCFPHAYLASLCSLAFVLSLDFHPSLICLAKYPHFILLSELHFIKEELYSVSWILYTIIL